MSRISETWNLLLDGPKPGRLNMAVDQRLLEMASHRESPVTYLRFYEWESPTLSLGFSQRADRVVNFAYCAQYQIEVVRRITGGKAVLHHEEVTYSVISNDTETFPENDINGTYRRIAQALCLGLQNLGLETRLAYGEPITGPVAKLSNACFAVSNHYEILCEGRKLVGSAQRRTKKAFLQHGSILLSFDPLLLSGATKDVNPLDLMSNVTCLNTCLGYCPSRLEVIHCLRQGFQSAFSVEYKLDTSSHQACRLADNLARSQVASLNSSEIGLTAKNSLL